MPARQLVIAIGGNAIQPPADSGSADAQRHRIEETAARLADLVQAGYDVVVTHGNGPQVGNILLQNEEARTMVPAMPLDVCGAESQAQIGYLLAQALRNEFAVRRVERGVAAVVTQTLVDANDPAFANPTKPIGPLYSRESELIVKRAKGWKLVEDKGRGGWRRVVPSPQPLDIIEKDVILRLVGDGDGNVVICTGGGGIPVVRRNGRLVGVEAVIDKDLGAAVLARVLGWKGLIIATDVEKVALGFGKPTQRFLEHMTVSEAKKHLAEGQFPPGSMGPKIQAAIGFLESGGEYVVVTDLEHLASGVDGKAGTRITKA
jgi:carbamate kinase